MKTRNEARSLERYLARAVEQVVDVLNDPDDMTEYAYIIMDLGYYDQPPEQHLLRGYLMGLREARETLLKNHLRRPRRKK